MKLINIGFGNLLSQERVVAIVSPDSAPIKRMVQETRERGMLIDATYGRKTASIFIMDSDHVVLFDDETKEKYIPYVIEPSLGADRVVLAFLCSAYDEENIGTEEKPDMRTVLHFHPALAPVKIGVLPLSKKLNEGAEKVFAELSKYYNCEFDDRGNIGKRYRRQDEIGTPFCVTYDFDSEEDGAVTVRDRDTMEQERVKIEDLKAYFEKKFEW